MPRKTRTADDSLRADEPTRGLFGALRRLEERGERLQVLRRQSVEMRHRTPALDAGRALQVRDLERDSLPFRALRRQIGRPQVAAAGAVVGVAADAADLREQLGPRDRLQVARVALLLRPGRNLAEQLGAKRLL